MRVGRVPITREQRATELTCIINNVNRTHVHSFTAVSVCSKNLGNAHDAIEGRAATVTAFAPLKDIGLTTQRNATSAWIEHGAARQFSQNCWLAVSTKDLG